MSKQTNNFQQLVHRIKQATHGSSAKVVESYLTEDPDRTEREVDIHIEEAHNGTVFKTAIECRNHGRKGSITWLDAVAGKYADLDYDRIILVNRRGFSAPAEKKASRLGIQLWTLTEATSEAWPNGLPKPWLVTYKENVNITLFATPQNRIPLPGGSTVTPVLKGWKTTQDAVAAAYRQQREAQEAEVRRQRPTLAALRSKVATIKFEIDAPDEFRSGVCFGNPPDLDNPVWSITPKLQVQCDIRALVEIPKHKRYFFEQVGSPALQPVQATAEIRGPGGLKATLVVQRADPETRST